MIRLRETGAREKDAATRLQMRLLKQVRTLRKSQSSPAMERNARTPQSPPCTRESTHSTGSSRHDRSALTRSKIKAQDDSRLVMTPVESEKNRPSRLRLGRYFEPSMQLQYLQPTLILGVTNLDLSPSFGSFVMRNTYFPIISNAHVSQCNGSPNRLTELCE